MIQQAQQSGQQAVVDAAATRGTGKATLPAPDPDAFGGGDKKKGKGKSKSDNPLGRGKPGTFPERLAHGNCCRYQWNDLSLMPCCHAYVYVSVSCSRAGGLPAKYSYRGYRIKGLVRRYLAM